MVFLLCLLNFELGSIDSMSFSTSFRFVLSVSVKYVTDLFIMSFWVLLWCYFSNTFIVACVFILSVVHFSFFPRDFLWKNFFSLFKF